MFRRPLQGEDESHANRGTLGINVSDFFNEYKKSNVGRLIGIQTWPSRFQRWNSGQQRASVVSQSNLMGGEVGVFLFNVVGGAGLVHDGEASTGLGGFLTGGGVGGGHQM